MGERLKELNLVDQEELDRFQEAVEAFIGQQMDADRFTALRLQQGVYGQRQEGVHMVRIKLPGGRLSPRKLRVIGDALERYSEHDVVHITTREDIQMHYVPTADTPATLKLLAAGGLTTREACGNTIRNVTTCALAGVCPREHVDVTTHLNGAVVHFLRNPLNQQLPRKFKISFSGCESDCAQGLMHDLGLVATRKDGRNGFKVMAGGGLGHKPHEAIIIEEFVEEKEMLLVMEAVVALHNKYSDRTKRAKSRIKFLVDRFGPQGFIEKYREELERTRAALAEQAYPQGEWAEGNAQAEAPGPGAPRHRLPQKQHGLHVLPISAPIGNLNAAQLRGIAQLMEDAGLHDIRTTQDQNLILMDVPQQLIAGLYAGFEALGLHEPRAGDNVVACPGTSTCRLGITSSTILGPKLNGGPLDLRMRVSGCHNGCAQPETGDIGIYGEGRRLHGKLIPHYQMYFGGNGMAGGGIAIKGPSVPSARIEKAVERVKLSYGETRVDSESFYAWTRRNGAAFFNELLADLIQVGPEDVASVLNDHGQQSDFRVLQLGGGECAGATQVKIGSSFFDAAHERNYRDALKFQRKFADAVKCGEVIAQLIGQGVVELLGGQKSESLADLGSELSRLAPETPELGRQLSYIAQEFARPVEELNDAGLTKLFAELDTWTAHAAAMCQGRDPQLDLAGALPKAVRVVPVTIHRQSVQASAA